MSAEDARKLIERLSTDEAFREKILAAPDVAERLDLAAAEGYNVTEEEVASASAELGDAELDAVAAGAWVNFDCTECRGRGWP